MIRGLRYDSARCRETVVSIKGVGWIKKDEVVL